MSVIFVDVVFLLLFNKYLSTTHDLVILLFQPFSLMRAMCAAAMILLSNFMITAMASRTYKGTLCHRRRNKATSDDQNTDGLTGRTQTIPGIPRGLTKLQSQIGRQVEYLSPVRSYRLSQPAGLALSIGVIPPREENGQPRPLAQRGGVVPPLRRSHRTIICFNLSPRRTRCVGNARRHAHRIRLY